MLAPLRSRAVLVHVGLGYTLMTVERDLQTLRVPANFNGNEHRNIAHSTGEVAFERRRIETQA